MWFEIIDDLVPSCQTKSKSPIINHQGFGNKLAVGCPSLLAACQMEPTFGEGRRNDGFSRRFPTSPRFQEFRKAKRKLQDWLS